MAVWGQTASLLLVSLCQHGNVDFYGRHPRAARVAVACVARCIALWRSINLRGSIALWRCIALRGSIAVGLGSSHFWPVPIWMKLRHVHLGWCWGNHTLCIALGGHIRLCIHHCGRVEDLWWKGLRTIHWGGRISVGSEWLGGHRCWHVGQWQPEGWRQLLTHTIPHKDKQSG